MEHPVLTGIFVAIASAFLGFISHIILDWFKSGRTEKGEYLTVQAFEKHREACCVIKLKQDFNLCKQEACTDKAKMEGRIISLEEKVRDSHESFQLLSDKMDDRFDTWGQKFDKLIQSVIEIQVTLKVALERERRDNGL